MIVDGRKTPFSVVVSPGRTDIEILEPLVHPPDVDMRIVREIVDAVQRLNSASSHGVCISITVRAGLEGE